MPFYQIKHYLECRGANTQNRQLLNAGSQSSIGQRKLLQIALRWWRRACMHKMDLWQTSKVVTELEDGLDLISACG